MFKNSYNYYTHLMLIGDGTTKTENTQSIILVLPIMMILNYHNYLLFIVDNAEITFVSHIATVLDIPKFLSQKRL